MEHLANEMGSFHVGLMDCDVMVILASAERMTSGLQTL